MRTRVASRTCPDASSIEIPRCRRSASSPISCHRRISRRCASRPTRQISGSPARLPLWPHWKPSPGALSNDRRDDGCARQRHPRIGPACISTAVSVSARLTCSPRSGRWPRSRVPTGPSWSTPTSSALSALLRPPRACRRTGSSASTSSNWMTPATRCSCRRCSAGLSTRVCALPRRRTRSPSDSGRSDSPPMISSERSRDSRLTSRSCGSTATTTATVGRRSLRSHCRTTRSARSPKRARDQRWMTGATCSGTSLGCIRRDTPL